MLALLYRRKVSSSTYCTHILPSSIIKPSLVLGVVIPWLYGSTVSLWHTSIQIPDISPVLLNKNKNTMGLQTYVFSFFPGLLNCFDKEPLKFVQISSWAFSIKWKVHTEAWGQNLHERSSVLCPPGEHILGVKFWEADYLEIGYWLSLTAWQSDPAIQWQ